MVCYMKVSASSVYCNLMMINPFYIIIIFLVLKYFLFIWILYNSNYYIVSYEINIRKCFLNIDISNVIKIICIKNISKIILYNFIRLIQLAKPYTYYEYWQFLIYIPIKIYESLHNYIIFLLKYFYDYYQFNALIWIFIWMIMMMCQRLVNTGVIWILSKTNICIDEKLTLRPI